jgi:hypothetical protein
MVVINGTRDDEIRKVVICKHCGHVQLSPLPAPEEDAEFYKEDNMYKNIFNDERWRQEEYLMQRYRPWVEAEVANFMKFVELGL